MRKHTSKFRQNIKAKLQGSTLSFSDLVEGAGGITGLRSHAQAKRVDAWPPRVEPISFVGSAINTTYTNTISLSGMGLEPNDFLFVFAGYDSSATYSVSTMTQMVNTSVGGMQIAIFRTQLLSVPTSINIGASANTIIAAGFRGVSTVGISSAVEEASNVATITPNSVSVSDGATAIIFAAHDDSVTATATAPSGYTIAEQGGVANGTQTATGAVMYKTNLVAGTESPAAVTWSETDTLAAYTIKLEA